MSEFSSLHLVRQVISLGHPPRRSRALQPSRQVALVPDISLPSDMIDQLPLLDVSPVNELFAPIEPLPTDGSLPILLDEPIDLKAKLAELEHDLIVAALDQTDWVTAHAANWLKLQRTTLVEKMRKHGIKQQH